MATLLHPATLVTMNNMAVVALSRRFPGRARFAAVMVPEDSVSCRFALGAASPAPFLRLCTGTLLDSRRGQAGEPSQKELILEHRHRRSVLNAYSVVRTWSASRLSEQSPKAWRAVTTARPCQDP